MATLSFVIPIYKKSGLVVEKCLKHILKQSLKDYEIICVFDGPDEYLESVVKKVLKNCPAPHQSIVIEHGGAPRARNAGRDSATGKYIVFWDADCYIDVHTAKGWCDWMDANPHIDFTYSGYEFVNEQGRIESQAFDPYLLKVRNYISGCFPIRREKCPRWDEGLESLQDWSFWLHAVAAGAKGDFMQGSGFSTEFPTQDSISGKGCSPEVWLSRMDAVRALHNIPKREVCVTSLHERMDGIALAKAIDADYQDHPNDKPNHYKTIIQIGFSVKPGEFERCAAAWGKQHKKIIFWGAEDVESIHDGVSLRALSAYAPRINALATQYVEDKAAQAIMKKAGFAVEVLPLPVISSEEVMPLPAKPKFLVDYSPVYAHVLNAIQRAIPDIELNPVGGIQDLSKYSGLVCFKQDRLLRPSVKRALAAGRHVLSNIQAPFAGFTEDKATDAAFMRDFVGKIRYAAKCPTNKEQVKFWVNPKRIEAVKGVLA